MGNIDRFKKRSAILIGRLAAIFNVILKRAKIDRILVKVKQARLRYKILMVVLVLAAAQFFAIIQPFLTDKSYALGNSSGLLSEKSDVMASKLKLDEQQQIFNFNSGQTLPTADQAMAGGSTISALAHRDSSKGLTVTDPINKIDFTMTPLYSTQAGRQDGNRIVYPLSGGNGWAVYTMQATGVKEDIILKKATKDKMSFEYKLGLGDNLTAKLEKDGSIGIYGNTLFSGSVATGSDKDAELLQKARKNAAKDTYLFGIPKPIVLEKNKRRSTAKAQYELHGDVLTIRVNNLKKGNYPLTIDPSIYVVTAQQFMAGNNETNINFDVDNKLIKKGRTTGARFDDWITANTRTIWSTSDVPTTTAGNDPASVEIGTKFRSSIDTTVTGVRFYKSAANTGTHSGHLWSSTGVLLSSVTFSGETSTGWQQAMFPSPISINANTTYVISYFAPAGNYAYDNGYFSTAKTNGSLTALQDGADGPNGVFIYGGAPAFPTTGFVQTNYWVDVITSEVSSNSPSSLPTGSWGAGAAAAGGYVYSAGGTALAGQIFTSQGVNTYTVPSGVTSLTVRAWGAGGGGGGGGSTGWGGDGGGGGYVKSTFTVTPGEILDIYVGGGGGGGAYSAAGTDAGGGGGGGGYSSIYRGGTLLALAAGGGGGGGARNTSDGADGGAGGGTSGIAGQTVSGGGGGGSGTAATGGAGGTAPTTNNKGSAGLSLAGGAGADGRSAAGADGGGVVGGLTSGGNGGLANINTTRPGGGGGGSGYFGGGGGGTTASTNGQVGGGGGGGSSRTDASATDVTNSAGPGTGTIPGGSTDSYRSNAADGGTGGTSLNGGSPGDNGLVAITYGSGSSPTSSVNWAKLNTGSGTIDSPNPGTGACAGWCTASAYNLPSARANFSLVAYNGFLYAMGGVDASGARTNTVYVAKLGANGEPQLWHPTDKNTSNWVYWYQDTGLSSVRASLSAVAYNNRMYVVGGIGASTPGSSVEIADILPNGELGSWSTSTTLPSAVYSHNALVYNDRLYVVGGSSSVGGAPSTAIYYNKINSDGTLNSWQSAANAMPTGRMQPGGNFAVIWGAYIYVSGGCGAVNASGYCTNTKSDTLASSINADGSLDTWNTVGTVTDQRMGHSLLAWRDNIYELGGCSSQDTGTGDCSSNMLSSINYGHVNQDGDASTVGQSVASGTSPCSGAAPTDCNLPGTANIGNMLNQSIIVNGYLYVMGGCVNNLCSNTSPNVAYVAITSAGKIAKPATCPSGAYQGSAWCVDNVHTLGTGLAAGSAVVFGGKMYLVGGLRGNNNSDTIYSTTYNSDGSIGAWTTQTLSGLGATSVSYTFAYARANPTAASTVPGNLYIFGGCTNSSSAGCTAYTDRVYKCDIVVAGTIANCTTTGQLQIGIIPGDSQTGLAAMSGTVYANYIYLIGGLSPNQTDLDTVRYAKFDNNNNVVSVGSGWVQSSSVMNTGRRRSAAFGYNGYLYAVGGYEASAGVLPDIEFIKINVSDGSLIGDPSNDNKFYTSKVEINQRWGLTVPISNSYAYVIGGCTTGGAPSNCTSRTDVIQTFQVYNNDSGAPASYTTSANTYGTNPNRIGVSSTILNGYIYAAGGCTSATDCTAAVNTVSYAAIDSNGNIGSWSNTTGNLPDVRAFGQLRSAGGTLYYIGGQSSTATDRRAEVYYATPSAGNVSSWSTANNGLPNARTKFGAAVWNNRLYVVGGEGTGTGCTASSVCNTVYVSPQLNSGGNIGSAWSTASTSFNVERSGTTAVAYANNLYLLGGYDGTNYLSDTQYSQINSSNGNAGSWSYSESLPGPLAQGDGFAANGYMYLIGGRSSATTCDPVTLVAPISANTTIASGNNPTGIGSWYETNQRYTGARYGNAATYYDGKAYILGGGCGATLTYASPVTQQTPLLSQPQVAKYSIMFDTDSDVFPSNWLLNGLDNSIGARWQLKYRSMTDPTAPTAGGGAAGRNCSTSAMSTWGSDTNFGNVTLALPGIYTPRDGSNTNTNCARYYYFNVTVDSSQAFGYPEDISRGPTITDLTLNFTADPSKRLMHGRTFTGGLQMPIDTPYYSN